MTYVIAEPCVNVIDQACVAVCPVDCIHFDPAESLLRAWARYPEMNAIWYQDREAARRVVNELRPEAGWAAGLGSDR